MVSMNDVGGGGSVDDVSACIEDSSGVDLHKVCGGVAMSMAVRRWS